MRAEAAAAALLAAASLAAGCGAGGGSTARAVSDPQAVRATVSGFTKAFGAGDGKKACELLTPAARAAFTKRVAQLAKTSDCARAIGRVHDAAGAQVTSAFTSATVGSVRLTGGSATAEVTSAGHSTTARLVKQGGAWRLLALPGE